MSDPTSLAEHPLLVLTFDGLATSSLSCYGSSWNRTPAIDAIAAGGCVWDRWTATSDQSLDLLRSWMMPASDDDPLAEWKSAGHVELITDDPQLDNTAIADCFDRCQLIDNPKVDRGEGAQRRPADDLDETGFGRLIAAAIDRDQRHPWSLLWLHSRFLTHCWDAPRSLFPIAEDEPFEEPSEEVDLLPDPDRVRSPALQPLPPLFEQIEPPSLELQPDAHPDLVTSWMRTYGCQVRLVDLLLEVLLESLTVDDPHVIVAGTSGMNLGQNGWIGPASGPLRSSDVRLPLVVSDRGPIRSPHVTPTDQLPGILSALRRSDPSLISPDQWAAEADSSASVETKSSRAALAITAQGWELIRDLDGSDHLFLKPDDVEDANDVGLLRPDVIEQLTPADPD